MWSLPLSLHSLESIERTRPIPSTTLPLPARSMPKLWAQSQSLHFNDKFLQDFVESLQCGEAVRPAVTVCVQIFICVHMLAINYFQFVHILYMLKNDIAYQAVYLHNLVEQRWPSCMWPSVRPHWWMYWDIRIPAVWNWGFKGNLTAVSCCSYYGQHEIATD